MARPFVLLPALVLAALPALAPVHAQPAARPPAAAELTPEQVAAAQARFEALPEEERRAIQRALIWAGGFSGTATGGFGPLTLRALLAFERAHGGQPDGQLDATERRRLNEIAARAQAAVGFAPVTDGRTGITLALPTALLTRRAETAEGTRFQTADETVTVTLRALPETAGPLTQLFERALVSSNPERRVTYRLQRPDFYVVAGETREGKFFSRLEQRAEGFRGVSIAYRKSDAARWDPLVVAIADSFAGGALASAPQVSPAPEPVPARPTGPALPLVRGGTALLVADGRAITATAALEGCASPRLAGQPARVAGTAGSLALLAATGLPPVAPLPWRDAASRAEEPLAIMAQAAEGGSRRLVLLPADRVTNGRIRAGVPPGGLGAAVVTADGAVAGIVTGLPPAGAAIAGVPLATSLPLAPESDLATLAGQAGMPRAADGGALAAGALAARLSGRVLALTCSG